MSSSKDFYSILGVAKNASADEIKRAHKKLVVKHHPDKFRDENEKKAANERFQDIQEAYEVLKDEKKRKQYDALGHDAFKHGSTSGGFEGFHEFTGASGFEDIFSSFFSGFTGGSSKQVFKGEDLRFSLEISLEDAFSGYETVIKIPRKVGCHVCSSSGNDPKSSPVTCVQCNGSGKIYIQQFVFRVQQTCNKCNGSGKSYKDCSNCRGSGCMKELSSVRIRIPKGVEDGMELHLKGEGNAIKGGVNGDLYIHIGVKKHPIFAVSGADLLLTVPISVFDAVLGKVLEIPTLEKKACSLDVPAGVQPGSKLYLRGKGMRRLNSEYRGDIIVSVEVEIPKYVSVIEKELWKKLQGEYKNTAKSKSFWEKLKFYWG